MVRIVLDANQFVSALLKPGSNPDLIMRLVRREKALLLLSDAICAELLRVLTYPKIRSRLNRTEEYLSEFIDKLRAVAVVVPGAVRLPPLQSDPSDTKYLECAVEGKANFIISGDHHLTDLHTFQKIRIVTPSTFLIIFGQQSVNNVD
jgi:uncharacterized protein